MKQVLWLLVGIMLLLSVHAQDAQDVNGDSFIDDADVIILNRMLSGESDCRCDFNGDGSVTLADYDVIISTVSRNYNPPFYSTNAPSVQPLRPVNLGPTRVPPELKVENTIDVPVGEPFRLRLGQTASLRADDGYTIYLDRIVDIACLAVGQCPPSGATVHIRKHGSNTPRIEVITPGNNFLIGNYELRLIEARADEFGVFQISRSGATPRAFTPVRIGSPFKLRVGDTGYIDSSSLRFKVQLNKVNRIVCITTPCPGETASVSTNFGSGEVEHAISTGDSQDLGAVVLNVLSVDIPSQTVKFVIKKGVGCPLLSPPHCPDGILEPGVPQANGCPGIPLCVNPLQRCPQLVRPYCPDGKIIFPEGLGNGCPLPPRCVPYDRPTGEQCPIYAPPLCIEETYPVSGSYLPNGCQGPPRCERTELSVPPDVISVPPSAPLTPPVDLPTEVCHGCMIDGNCLPLGNRLMDPQLNKPVYCDIGDNVNLQKADGEICQNNYECTSNTCSNSACVDLGARVGDLEREVKEQRGLIERMLSWFKSWFGG